MCWQCLTLKALAQVASQEVSWPHLIASAGTCKSLVASDLEIHIYFKFSAYCTSTGTFILYYQHILHSLCKPANNNTVKAAQPKACQEARNAINGLFKEGKKREKVWYLLQ